MFGPVSWEQLGLALGIYITTLNVIEKEKGDSTDYLRKTLQQWLNKVDKVKDTRWPTLIKAVRSTGDNAAADRMPNAIKKHSSLRKLVRESNYFEYQCLLSNETQLLEGFLTRKDIMTSLELIDARKNEDVTEESRVFF
uniref:Death domain-containing protein n=1 Tax=Amphimedon queenslandica TaxID=400682 RepID=A0A1X7TPS2_AMPQE